MYENNLIINNWEMLTHENLIYTQLLLLFWSIKCVGEMVASKLSVTISLCSVYLCTWLASYLFSPIHSFNTHTTTLVIPTWSVYVRRLSALRSICVGIFILLQRARYKNNYKRNKLEKLNALVFVVKFQYKHTLVASWYWRSFTWGRRPYHSRSI